jgi:Ca-activated chloride channel family protein
MEVTALPFAKKLTCSLLASIALASPLLAAERAIIVLDGSGSMWAQIDGVARISIARDTLDAVLANVPEGLELGLMTYGHREKGQCSDIELLVPPGAGTGAAIGAAARAINPKGMTPLSDAVRLAAEELRYVEEKATVILITDGIETCEADPCALASALEGQGIDFTTHVVGFGLSDEEGQAVACLAENTGGRYLPADDAASLVAALSETVAEVADATPQPAPTPEPAVLEFNLQPVASMAEGFEPLAMDAGNSWHVYKANADGSEGEWVGTEYNNGARFSLEPGDYVLVAELGSARVSQPLSVAQGELYEPYFVLNAGTLVVRPRAAKGEPINDGAAVRVDFGGDGPAQEYGETTFVLPAGEVTLTVEVGEGTNTETFAIAAGEIIEKDVVVGVGRAVLNAFYVPEMKVDAGGLSVRVVGAKKDMQGNREDFSYGYGPDNGFDLPPGDYVAILKMDEAESEVPFTITAGETTEVNATLGAGVVVFEMPGAEAFNLYGAKADIQGNRKEFGYGYGESYQTTLPAGDYVVAIRYKDSDTAKETGFSVTAGERTEVMAEQ